MLGCPSFVPSVATLSQQVGRQWTNAPERERTITPDSTNTKRTSPNYCVDCALPRTPPTLPRTRGGTLRSGAARAPLLRSGAARRSALRTLARRKSCAWRAELAFKRRGNLVGDALGNGFRGGRPGDPLAGVHWPKAPPAAFAFAVARAVSLLLVAHLLCGLDQHLRSREASAALVQDRARTEAASPTTARSCGTAREAGAWSPFGAQIAERRVG
jgi:hypothetical protein